MLDTFDRIRDFVWHPRRRSFALNDLDIKLRPFLNYRKGFFVEAGANDGRSQSNTLYFEKYYGWKGILIEPIPDLAAKCRANRPKCIVENCALVPADFQGDVIEMRYCNLMSLVKGAMKSEASDLAHVQLGCKVQQISTYDLTVPGRTLSSILEQHQVARIDLLSLDVEGFELQALGGLDFSRHRPVYVLVEARFRNEIDDVLEPYYTPVAELSEHDVLYKNNVA